MPEKKQGRLIAPRRKDGSYEFSYTPSHSTNVRKTFERIRAEHDQQRALSNVRTIARKR